MIAITSPLVVSFALYSRTPLRLELGFLRQAPFVQGGNARPCTPLGHPACARGGGARASRTRTSATSSGSARSGRGARTTSPRETHARTRRAASLGTISQPRLPSWVVAVRVTISTPGGLALSPSSSWDVTGGVLEAEWIYRLDLNRTERLKERQRPMRRWLRRDTSPAGKGHGRGSLCGTLAERGGLDPMGLRRG